MSDETAKYDLSHTTDNSTTDAPKKDSVEAVLGASTTGGKSIYEVQRSLYEDSLRKKDSVQGRPVAMIQVKSNHLRNKIETIDGVNLRFNEEGLASVAKSDLSKIEAYQRVRPGRLTIIEPVVVAEVKQAAVVVPELPSVITPLAVVVSPPELDNFKFDDVQEPESPKEDNNSIKTPKRKGVVVGNKPLK